jgi:hypothetical protein
VDLWVLPKKKKNQLLSAGSNRTILLSCKNKPRAKIQDPRFDWFLKDRRGSNRSIVHSCGMSAKLVTNSYSSAVALHIFSTSPFCFSSVRPSRFWIPAATSWATSRRRPAAQTHLREQLLHFTEDSHMLNKLQSNAQRASLNCFYILRFLTSSIQNTKKEHKLFFLCPKWVGWKKSMGNIVINHKKKLKII